MGFTTMQIGYIGTGIGIVFGINQMRIVPYVSKFYKPYQMILRGHIMMALGLGLMTFARHQFDFLLYAGLTVSGVARCMTLFNTIISHYSSDDAE